jgi:hypothetical protein
LVVGFPQLKVLNRLNVSSRSSSRCVPTTDTSFEIARSICQNAGPTASCASHSPGCPAPRAQRRPG